MITKNILIVLIVALLASCVYLPTTSKGSGCVLFTKSLKIKKYSTADMSCGLGPDACLAVLTAVSTVAISSLIISGSIVLVGNTFHWLEKEGRCKDSYIRTKISEFVGLFSTD